MADFTSRDFDTLANYIKTERDSRVSQRFGLEQKWKEVDRQLAMDPKPKNISSGQAPDWYPALEEPLQYDALEVIMADLQSMIFPQTSEWYSALSNVSDDYLKRFEGRRERFPLIAEGELIGIDQSGTDALVKAVMDYFHRIYDFRAKFSLTLVEMVKYGVGAGRVREVVMAKYGSDFRGVKDDTLKGPVLAPTSIWNTYPDPSPNFVLHEGFMTRPTDISTGTQLLDDMKRAAKIGGRSRGWRVAVVNKLEPLKSHPQDKRDHVEKIEAEGDIIVPKSQGSIFLPNVLVTVAVGGNGCKVVRLQKNPLPYRSYFYTQYLKDNVRSAYGGSPMLKAQPIQEASAFILSDVLAASRLGTIPPVAWDANDTRFVAQGGPKIHPGALWEMDNPEKGVFPQKVGNLNEALAAYSIMQKKFEDTLATNDPRRGQGLKSHTGSQAHQLDVIRGVARTQDVADDVATGPLTTVLYMEYDVIKRALTKARQIPISTAGMEGWVTLQKDDLPDDVMFTAHGASGVAIEQQREAQFIQATNAAVQLVAAAAQQGEKIDIDFLEIITEIYQNAGVQNAAKFVRKAQAAAGGVEGTSGVPGLNPEAGVEEGVAGVEELFG